MSYMSGKIILRIMKTILRIVVLGTGYAERSWKCQSNFFAHENSWAIKINYWFREPYIKNSIAVALIWVVWDIIKNEGRDWMHFEMPIWHFILVKWVCINQSIQKSSNSSQCLRNWKEFGGSPLAMLTF